MEGLNNEVVIASNPLARQEALVAEFEFLDDWRERFKEIINFGNRLAELPSEFKQDLNLVRGCQNRVWIGSRFIEDKVFYYADSESQIVKGLIAMLVYAFSGFTPNEILNTPPHFIAQLGLDKSLLSNRLNGLQAALVRIRQLALGYQLVIEAGVGKKHLV
jgi:cysteine desulfuration protein SufE